MVVKPGASRGLSSVQEARIAVSVFGNALVASEGPSVASETYSVIALSRGRHSEAGARVHGHPSRAGGRHGQYPPLAQSDDNAGAIGGCGEAGCIVLAHATTRRSHYDWLARGPQAIAESLGVERRTVYLWFSDPMVKEEVQRRCRDVANLITERLAGLRAQGARPIVRGQRPAAGYRSAGGTAEKLEVIREILDRCAYTVRASSGHVERHGLRFSRITGPRWPRLTGRRLCDELESAGKNLRLAEAR